MNVTPATRARSQLFVDGKISIAPAADLHLAIIRRKIITMIITPTAGMDKKPVGRTADMRIGPARLINGQLPDNQLPVEITTPGKIQLQVIRLYHILQIHITPTRSIQMRQHLTRNIGLHMPVRHITPVKTLVIQINTQYSTRYLGTDPVPDLRITRAHRNRLLTTLGQIKIDPTRDLHIMKTTDIPLLRVPVIYNLIILGSGKKTNKTKNRKKEDIFHK